MYKLVGGLMSIFKVGKLSCSKVTFPAHPKGLGPP